MVDDAISSSEDPVVRALTFNQKPHEAHRDHNKTDLRPFLKARSALEVENGLPGGARTMFALRPITRP
jgi:hypothetical protein